MKADLATSIVVAVIGGAIAFFVANLLIPGFSDVQFKTISGKADYSLADPDPEIFNYRALNPTVEVYVGENTTSINVEE